MNKKKKKKGFTLIELVIVLAVLAIIALIAIPNFNKVRTDSQKKADDATCDVIERVTTMAIANGDLKVDGTGTGTITIAGSESGGTVTNATGITWADTVTRDSENLAPNTDTDTDTEPAAGQGNYEKSLSEVRAPQVKGKGLYQVTIDTNDAVTEVETIPTPTSGS